MIEGSSIDSSIMNEVFDYSSNFKKKLVILDSNHTYDHVIKELEIYAPLVSIDSYCIVCDTAIADMPNIFHENREWNTINNPKKAVREFLSENKDFESDIDIDNRLLISSNPEGYIKRLK